MEWKSPTVLNLNSVRRLLVSSIRSLRNPNPIFYRFVSTFSSGFNPSSPSRKTLTFFSNPHLWIKPNLHILPSSCLLRVLSKTLNFAINPNPDSGFLQSQIRSFFISTRRSINFDRDEFSKIADSIKRGETDFESKLNRMNLSQAQVKEILHTLNARGAPALRFYNWVMKTQSNFEPCSEIYNLIIDNHGRIGDFDAMLVLLRELSLKGHCLSEKAFEFLAVQSSNDVRHSIIKVLNVLNLSGGSCRGSGTQSLIKLLCNLGYFDLAIYVMELTMKKTSYYNVLIAAKCRNGDFRDARDVIEGMNRFGFDPNTKSYNYLLGCLFKNGRVAEACELLEAMEHSGYLPDAITYEMVALHSCRVGKMDEAIAFIERMVSEGLRPRISTHAGFIKGYFLLGRVNDAHKYVLDMSVRDKYSVNANYSLFVKMLLQSGKVVDAGMVLVEMMQKGLIPDFVVYKKVVSGLDKMGRRDLARELKQSYSNFTSCTDGGRCGRQFY
ncbi:hypothetical protein QJS04_geneDACA005589 [Acorus gramineus]|uniref:Pentatricopeptide repeat-containing protein n=1 Tax=Acorus gramineus TaxID=55184 RepID=A0AAV9A557_ACOGR|nr:hypothetical protein QJS04_geneDACA005589 [Acorus gramineus]